MKWLATIWCLLALTAGLAGCELFRDLDDVQLDAAHCEPDVTVECVCADGAMGTQTCRADGTYETCRCPGPETADAGTDTSPGDGSETD